MAKVIKFEQVTTPDVEQAAFEDLQHDFTELMACDITGRCEGAKCEYYGTKCGGNI